MNRKILVPLATVAAASAVAVGSGATFTSATNNTLSAVTSGTLQQANSKADGAIFTLTNLKPGDTLNGTLTVTNTGTLPATFSLTEATSTNAFSAGSLSLEIVNTGTNAVIYSGPFGGLEDGVKNDLGTVQPGVVNTYRFRVVLAATATNDDQGKKAEAAYTWDSVQLDAETYQR